jgi:hypothetical protein
VLGCVPVLDDDKNPVGVVHGQDHCGTRVLDHDASEGVVRPVVGMVKRVGAHGERRTAPVDILRGDDRPLLGDVGEARGREIGHGR